MESAQRESRKHPVNPERKYIRLQTVGMSFVLAWPVAMMLAAMYSLEFWIPHISVLLIIIGTAFFSTGHIGRQELKEQREREAGSKVKKI